MGRDAMNNNMIAIVQMLLDDAQRQAEQLREDARQQAERILAQEDEKARKECAAILEQYKRQAVEHEKREQLRLKMDQRRMLLSAKQQLIDQTVSQVYDRLIAQTDDQWVCLLSDLLKRSEGAEKPKIIVPAALQAAVQAEVGQEYTVLVGEMRHGFILSYSQYDLNYGIDRLFSYQKEGFEQQAAQYLFGDDADE